MKIYPATICIPESIDRKCDIITAIKFDASVFSDYQTIIEFGFEVKDIHL